MVWVRPGEPDLHTWGPNQAAAKNRRAWKPHPWARFRATWPPATEQQFLSLSSAEPPAKITYQSRRVRVLDAMVRQGGEELQGRQEERACLRHVVDGAAHRQATPRQLLDHSQANGVTANQKINWYSTCYRRFQIILCTRIGWKSAAVRSRKYITSPYTELTRQRKIFTHSNVSWFTDYDYNVGRCGVK